MDLWQLGRMIRLLFAAASRESNEFSAKLQGQHFSNAAEALASLW